MINPRFHFKARQALLIATLACFLALLVWGGAYWWANQAAGQALAVAAAVQASQVSQSEVLGFTKLLDRTASDRVLVNNYFLTPETVINFLTTLEQLAELSGVDLEITEVVESDNLTVSLQASGRFSQLNHFIDLISAAPYLVTVNQLRLNYGAVPTIKKSATFAWLAEIDLTVASFDQLGASE